MNAATKSTAIERLQALAVAIRDDVSAIAPFAKRGSGLVVVAGGANGFTSAYVLFHVLRHVLKSPIQAELWHFGQAEISAAMAAAIAPLDVALVDALPILAARGSAIRDGWQLKSFAIQNSAFRHVLLLDADQVPVVDPASLFEWKEYRDRGAIFWPDITDLKATNEVWAALGLAPRRAVSLESGQILVDSVRHSRPVRAAVRLNEAADDLYRLIYGDKDTYRLAWELTDSDFLIVPHRPYVDAFMLVQRNFDGHALFQHRTSAKWTYSGVQRGVTPFVHEAACENALESLRKVWGGRTFTAPDRHAAARRFEDTLIERGPFVLDADGEPTVTIAFAAHAELSDGRGADRKHWWIECSGNDATLFLTDGERRTYALGMVADGTWTGRRLRAPIVDVSLCPISNGRPVSGSDNPGIVDEILRAAGAFAEQCPRLGELGVTLSLLAEVLPDVRLRLDRLAGNQTDPTIAQRLRLLADGVARPACAVQVDRSFRIENGYIKAELCR